MDAIALLKKDHATVKKLFKRLLDDREIDHARADDVFRRLREELAIHADIEEQVFYPALRDKGGDEFEDDVLEALEEHHVAKVTLAELDKMSTEDERFEAKLTVLREYLLHHIREEEATLFPAIREALSKQELLDLGKELADARRIAPTRPHPAAPDEPPGNRLNMFAAAMDRGRDMAASAIRIAFTLPPLRRFV